MLSQLAHRVAVRLLGAAGVQQTLQAVQARLPTGSSPGVPQRPGFTRPGGEHQAGATVVRFELEPQHVGSPLGGLPQTSSNNRGGSNARISPGSTSNGSVSATSTPSRSRNSALDSTPSGQNGSCTVAPAFRSPTMSAGNQCLRPADSVIALHTFAGGCASRRS